MSWPSLYSLDGSDDEGNEDVDFEPPGKAGASSIQETTSRLPENSPPLHFHLGSGQVSRVGMVIGKCYQSRTTINLSLSYH
ncbi:conserved hypothetical protein [Ricinus communis]|uniref:Uncharacterized protein n=1 Tax=Ricinus communis TaxID=3988 RepID=B9SR83_RICCO|nr:conserved hypothetical protein [Ricinus communis]